MGGRDFRIIILDQHIDCDQRGSGVDFESLTHGMQFLTTRFKPRMIIPIEQRRHGMLIIN
jgi:hypothetical protein